jgi:hypothetical protein
MSAIASLRLSVFAVMSPVAAITAGMFQSWKLGANCGRGSIAFWLSDRCRYFSQYGFQ